MDDSLTWSEHVSQLCRRLSSITFLLRRLKDMIGPDSLKQTYFALFHSVLVYGIVVWGNSTSSINAFRMQKRALRVLCGVGYRAHCQPLFKREGIMTLPCAYIYFTLLEIHQTKSIFARSSDIHTHSTRHSHDLRPNCYRLKKSQNNSLNLNLYNKIPLAIRDLNNIKFKTKIKQFLLKHCFYSVNEFINTSCQDWE